MQGVRNRGGHSAALVARNVLSVSFVGVRGFHGRTRNEPAEQPGPKARRPAEPAGRPRRSAAGWPAAEPRPAAAEARTGRPAGRPGWSRRSAESEPLTSRSLELGKALPAGGAFLWNPVARSAFL